MFAPREPEPPITLGLNQPAAAAEASVPAPEELQFQKAEKAGDPHQRMCTLCRQPIASDYFHVSGKVACPNCAQSLDAFQKRRGGAPEFGRALLFGIGGAILGAILYAVVTLVTHMQFSLMAIVVGIIVGKAVLLGSRGCRGRRFQVLAVLLTYIGITTSHVPQIIEVLNKQAVEKTAPEAVPAPTGSRLNPPANLTLGKVVFAYGFLVVLALALPFLAIASVSGLLNLLIIGIGLRQAWRLAAPVELLIMGPYSAAEPAAAGA